MRDGLSEGRPVVDGTIADVLPRSIGEAASNPSSERLDLEPEAVSGLREPPGT